MWTRRTDARIVVIVGGLGGVTLFLGGYRGGGGRVVAKGEGSIVSCIFTQE
jgi:hypothetical protein